MTSLTDWKRLRGLVQARRAELRFCLRVTVAGVLSFTIAQLLDFPLHGLWIVLTAIVVSQMSVGGSVRATLEYIVGTLGGAIYAAVIGVLVPHPTPVTEGVALALTIAPLALVAAVNPNFRVAPFSAVLVLLFSGQVGESPIESAFIRSSEVALGGMLAIAVSLLVFPQRAHRVGLQNAARILDQMARGLPRLLAGFTQSVDRAEISRIQNAIGDAVAALQAVAAEAQRERLIRLATEPEEGPLPRTLLRLRHDLVIIGRGAVTPLPDVIAQRLHPVLARVGACADDFLRGCATALVHRTAPPPRAPAVQALEDFNAAIDALRAEGCTRSLSSGEVEQVFTLGFALDQMAQNFVDLERCVQDYARYFAGKGRAGREQGPAA